jgi:hypothetical protein
MVNTEYFSVYSTMKDSASSPEGLESVISWNDGSHWSDGGWSDGGGWENSSWSDSGGDDW